MIPIFQIVFFTFSLFKYNYWYTTTYRSNTRIKRLCIIKIAILIFIETFNNFPKEDRVRLTAEYLKNKEYRTMIKENPVIRSTPPELIEEFYKRQAELDKETREQAIKFINIE